MDWDRNGMVTFKEFLFAFTRWIGIDDLSDEEWSNSWEKNDDLHMYAFFLDNNCWRRSHFEWVHDIYDADVDSTKDIWSIFFTERCHCSRCRHFYLWRRVCLCISYCILTFRSLFLSGLWWVNDHVLFSNGWFKWNLHELFIDLLFLFLLYQDIYPNLPISYRSGKTAPSGPVTCIGDIPLKVEMEDILEMDCLSSISDGAGILLSLFSMSQFSLLLSFQLLDDLALEYGF